MSMCVQFSIKILHCGVLMIRTISSFVSLAAVIVIISACTCSYCEKLEYRDTQATIEAEIQKQAENLSKKSHLQEEDILAALSTLLSGNSRIFGAAYATAPYDENNELMETYYVFHEDKDLKTLHDPSYNFITSANSSWIKKPYLNKKAMWSIPYYDIDGSGAKNYMTTYSYPVLENGNVIFILSADYLLSTE